MSHFTVMVIGDCVEEQLEPYDENIQTAPRKTYMKKEDVDRMLDFYMKEKKLPAMSPKDLVPHMQDWNGSKGGYDKKGLFYYATYNENSKWDWYSIGGRWGGFFKLKPQTEGLLVKPHLFGFNKESDKKELEEYEEMKKEGRADQAVKKDIDWEGMIREARENAEKEYDRIADIFDGKIPKIKTWDKMIKAVDKLKDEERSKAIDEIRKEYHNQEPVKKLKESKIELGIFGSLDDYQMSREKYIQRAEERAFQTFAVLKDGIWYEHGRMGWWGMSFDEMPEKKWAKTFKELIDDTEDDTLFTIVDCHI